MDWLHVLNFIWYEESIEGNICSIWILSSRKARLDLSPTFTSLLICLVGNSSWWCFENDLFSDVDIICLCWRQSLVFFSREYPGVIDQCPIYIPSVPRCSFIPNQSVLYNKISLKSRFCWRQTQFVAILQLRIKFVLFPQHWARTFKTEIKINSTFDQTLCKFLFFKEK